MNFLLYFSSFFFVNLFSFFFWIDTLRRISCWDLLLLRLITGFKSFYMQQLQMQSKFNFSLSLLNDFPSILFNSLATLFLFYLFLFLYRLLFNHKCCMLSEHAGVSVCVNACVSGCLFVCGVVVGVGMWLFVYRLFVLFSSFLLFPLIFILFYLLLTQKLIIFKQLLFVNLF